MDEHIFEVYLINKARHTEQNPVAEWVQLPTDAEKMKEVFARIGVDGIDPSEYEVAAYESPIDGLTDRFRPGESLDELNYLAALLAQRSQEEREKFAAAMIHGDHAASIADAINLTHNLDCYWLYPAVRNSEDYGHYVVDELDELELPEAAKKYFDYKAFGRDAVREDGGTFTDYGYIYNNKNDFAVWYADHDIPKEHRITPDQPDTVFMDAAAVPQQAAAVTEPQQPIPICPIELTATDTAGKVKEITAQLEAGVKDLFHSERYQDYLKAMSKFHDYSLNNTLLIVMQKPDASLVAGFNKWRDEFERHVKRGEKGIKILAPAPYKIKKEQEKLDPDGKPVIGDDGKPVTEQKEITIPAFKVVSVFDVSQTDGKEIPDIAVDSLTGSVEQYEDFFKALEQTSPVPVGFERIDSGAHGYYHNTEKRIALNEGESELQTVKTLIHEIAHAKLHDIDLNAPPEQQQERPSRRTREVEAESIAYTVCQHFGLDTSDYSFGYVAGWSSDKDIKELKAFLETIRATASELITEIDGHFRELQQQREAAQEERPVLESLAPEQQQAIRDEVQATLQMLADTDMQIYGEVSQGTLDALAAQGYVLQDGVVQREPAALSQQEQENAYRLDDGTYLYVQTSDNGYDYTLYDSNMKDLDGGQLDNPDLSMTAARDEILALHELHPSAIESIPIEDFEQLRDAAEQVVQQPEHTFSIYQLKDGDETWGYRFEPLDRLRAVGLDVQRDNYDLVYSAPLADGDSLEDIYRRFNLDHPADFTGHSLSVSDIVVLRHGDTETAHYCDSFGFTEVPEFLQQQEQTAHKWNGIDGLLNNKPFMLGATPTEQANALIDLAEQDGQRLGNAERGLIVQYHEQVQDLPKTIALVNELCEKGFEQQHGHLDYLVKQRVDAEITAAVQERQQSEPLPPSLDPAVQPVVTIIWSESDKLREGEQMPLARADALFKSLDKTRRTEREQPGYDGSWYDKTKFRIDFTFHGEADNYEGRQDFGDGDGSLIDHIQAHHEYYSQDESYKNSVIRNEGAEAWAQEQAEREMILSEFVPYMRLHCNLYEQERTAADMLESGGELTPEQTAYFNAVLSHVDTCREKLNAGEYTLPAPPQFADFAQEAAEMEAYKAHVREEIAQEAAAAGMTVEEYAANGYEPREQPIDAPQQTEAAVPEESTPAQAETAAVKYYPINEGAARRANDANSFRDYTPGSATAAYRQMVDQAAELAQNQKSRVDPMHHERIDQLLDTYARRLAENMNNSYAIEARVPSILIAGGSNFPVRKKEKQNAARDRNMQDWQDVQGILDKIRSTGMGGISADDPQAVAKLEAKLVKLEAAQETMKGVNAYYRKHGTLEGCTLLKPEQIKELQEGMAQSWHLEKNKPFQSFELSNNNAEIRRIRGRIEQLKQHEDKSFVGWEFDGGRVEANKTDNRLQIFFDEKPDDAARAELKANGFKWAPSAGAWQRQLNNNAYYAAGYVSCIQPISGEKPIDLQRNAQHQQAAPTPDALLTGEQITTPRGSFHLTSMSVEQMREAGYGIHHTSEDGKYHIMGNGTQAFAVAVEQPENYLKNAEMSTEQNYNMIDGRINNTPSVDELEEKAKRGEVVSLSALAAAIKAEDGRTPQRDSGGKKPSIRAQLKADRQQAAKMQKQDKEKKRSIKKDLEME